VRLQGKVAIVTGAGGGIGEGIARRFAREGAKTVIADIDDPNGKRVVAAIRAEGGEASFVHADVSDEASVEAMVNFTVSQYGTVNVLVNNAGILQFTGIETLSRPQWDRILAVNLTGPVLCAKHVVPHMREGGGGAIVNISSIQAVLTGPKFAAYCSSKHGVIGLTRTMALELGPMKIRVNAILPGYIRTPLFMADATRMGEGDPDRFIRTLEPTVALGRIGEPEDIAGPVLFAASDDAAYMTGASFAVDGGVTIQL
jgi:NAD(P)-dependent dehydrogenase (short-subunit alcohol dehydrogenase family)